MEAGIPGRRAAMLTDHWLSALVLVRDRLHLPPLLPINNNSSSSIIIIIDKQTCPLTRLSSARICADHTSSHHR